jgi:glycerol-3-phosphate dehydrogenase subunit B
LACGIKLQKAGKRCAIISSGQSALHFSSGSFDLLNTLPDGTEVINPVASLPALIAQNAQHPYAKIGEERFAPLADEAQQLLADAGVPTSGSCHHNAYRITPLALARRTWLIMDDFIALDNPHSFPWSAVALFSIRGYLDFYPQLFANTLRREGLRVHEVEIDLTRVEKRKRNPSELRSTNIARLFDDDEAIRNLANILRKESDASDAILLPACLGLDKTELISELSRTVGKPVRVLATFPPSVAGIRAQYLLKQAFLRLGGIYMLGDTVDHVSYEGSRVTAAHTVNHGDIPMRGDEFVLCSGSFFSQGLVALPDNVIDPICGLDVDALPDRQQWYSANVFDRQKYLSFGICTDPSFCGMRAGEPVTNLHVCGASLGGFDAMKEGCGGGVSLLTALYVADSILNKDDKTVK